MNRVSFRRAVLACGAESKGVFSLAKGRNLFVSRDFGNLEEYGNFSKYQKDIRRNIGKLNIEPALIACDMHPGYNSTIFAEELKSKSRRLVKIQHHHAHIVSCMAENNLKEKAIGVAFDGTGYGTDGAIWGGEFLVSTLKDFKRAAHLKYVPMPGGDKAVVEPWRMAAVYLNDAFGDNFLRLDMPFTKKICTRDWKLLKHLVDKNINSPKTSSVGRLFDAVASMLLRIFKVSYEAEAAIKLQECAEDAKDENGIYKYSIVKKDSLIIDPQQMIKGIVRDIKNGIDGSTIASKFHNTIAEMVGDICALLKISAKTNKIVLSGGVFQNRLLTKKILTILKRRGFNIYTHKQFSTTDAGVSIGQAMIAAARS
jgi:hydrogenase maturation protein HypF